MTLTDLVEQLGGVQLVGDADLSFDRVEYDSRKVGKGTLFVCVPGYRVDGHDFAAQAVAQGAVALVVERVLPDLQVPQLVVADSRRALALSAIYSCARPADGMFTVGITGTNGKTTTAHLCEAVVRARGKNPGMIGTIHAQVGGRRVSVSNTTPESLDLHRLLRQMRDCGQDAVVMEVSSHALALERTHGLPIDVAVFTNLTHDHLDFHSDMEDYFQAKLRLFTQLTYRDGRACPFAVVNADDPYAARILKSVRTPFITYGLCQGAHIRAEHIDIQPEGVSYTVCTPMGSQRVNLQMSGLFNVLNSLAAIGVGLASRVDLAEAVTAVESVTSVSGRFELVREGQEFAVVVDYAHTPDGLSNLLRSAREVTTGRLITVFGCGGDRDRSKRPVMGEIAGRLSDLVILTSDNPRSENPRHILAEILGGVPEGAEVQTEVDRAAAIFQAVRLAGPGDTVVIAGKGHETYQIIKDKTIEFDDREVARKALRGRPFRGQRNLRNSVPAWTEKRRAGTGEGTAVAGEP